MCLGVGLMAEMVGTAVMWRSFAILRSGILLR
jgi:hypothetical protein